MIKNTKELSSQNKKLILNEIIKEQPISRKKLSQSLDFSHTTISNITKDLMIEGLIREAEIQQSTGGRPPTLLEFRGDNKYLIAVEMSYTFISYAIYDLDFNLKEQDSWSIIEMTAAEIIEMLYKKSYQGYFQKQGIDNQQIVGIGISVPGIYDPERDLLLESISDIWTGINLKALFSKYFSLPLYIENDANLSTYYEAFYGVGIDALNMIYLFIAEGIGSGLIINRELYKGSHGLAGEISHLKASKSDYLCHCGATGCLEVMASMAAIKREVIGALQQNGESHLHGKSISEITIAEIVKAYKNGDPLVENVVNQANTYLLKTLSDLQNFLDPDLIIIGDIYNLYDQKMIKQINQSLKDLSSNSKIARVVQRTEEDFMQLKATARYVFDSWKYKV